MRTMTKHLLMAAIAAVPVLGLTHGGSAQVLVDQGRAMDANTRAGSQGYNDGIDRSMNQINAGQDRTQIMGNQVITGNVTAGRHFRGNVPYTDPRAFRGPTAGTQSDAFIRESGGVPIGPGVGSNAMTPRPFYGASRAVPPPEGMVPQGFTGGYIPAPRVEPDLADTRLGRPLDDRVPPSNRLLMPGSDQTMISASTLYGVRQWQVGDERDRSFLNNYTNLFGDRTRTGLDDAAIERMRQELRGATDADRQESPADPLRSPIETQRLAAQEAQGGLRVDPQQVGTDPLGRQGLETGQRTRNRLLLDAETQQRVQHSAQYQQLREARRQLYGTTTPQTDVEAARDFNEQMRIAQQIQAETQQQQPVAQVPREQVPDAQPPRVPLEEEGIGRMPLAQRDQQRGQDRPDRQRPQPVRIESFAQGIDAEGLRNLMNEAEALMQEGKWISALQKYEDAARVAPDERLIVVARAIAELGATYYAHAETDLRRAFTRDPNLLMAQYDLRELIGEDRLQFISDDLKEIANKEQQSARPLLLLAFIAYNTGYERSALGYIDLAERRAGGKDEFLQVLKEHWSLPENDTNNNNK
jgi:hypothetical protein